MHYAIYIFVLLIISITGNASGNANFAFKGGLVQEPCNIDPADLHITIDVGFIVNKLLYSHQRTAGIPLTLNLSSCDITTADQAIIKFIANEDDKQPGLIRLDAGSTAQGIAIGIEDKGVLLPVNTSTAKNINAGDNQISFNFFISADKESLKNKQIKPGTLQASTTIELEYQ